MFTSILNGASSGITLSAVLLCLCSAFLCGLITALVYHGTEHSTREFAITLAVLPCIVMAVILMVNGNLGIGVAVAGSFSLVRFRSIPGRSSDIAMIFLVMMAGLACGTGYAAFAVLMTVCINIVFLLLFKSRMFTRGAYRYLTIEIPENLDYSNAFDDIFAKYTAGACRETVKTVQMGSLYELQYEVKLLHPSQEKEFLDAIRTRNGNLSVRCSLHAPVSCQL